MGVRTRLPLISPPQRRPATLARPLQHAKTAQLTRRPATDQPRSQRLWVGHLAADFFSFRLEVDDHVRDRDGEALSGLLHDAALEPVRAPFRMRGQDDLVGAEGAEGVLDRLEGIAVADLAARGDPGLLEPAKGG